MTDLIRALIQIKTPISLFAFVSFFFLLAFRTKQVPELFFALAREKLTKERFAQLLHRFMLFAFTAFVLLCVMAVAGQVLAVKTQPRPLSLEDLRSELTSGTGSEDQKQVALKEYADGLAYIQTRDFAQAIQALQKSIESIPSLAAQMTLAYLYQKQGDRENAKKYATAARSLASLRGDSLAQVRLEKLSDGAGSEGSGSRGLVGNKVPVPEGGSKFEDAVAISPGLYITTRELATGVYEYFKVRLNAGQTLRLDFRTPDAGGEAGASIYDSDGVLKQSGEQNNGGALGTVQWTTPVDGRIYLSIGNRSRIYPNSANTVYRISIE
jgi:tetratricopeptide (TPR) repeat protein